MPNKLSIIMPCYNCESTLEEALASVYTQGLTVPFEIVMIDDGSTDNTRELIVKLKDKFPNIRVIFHDTNKGGGAARNTGIKNTDGDLIFCLDSDNFFPPNILQGMLSYLLEKKCDGVAIDERRFFLGSNTKKYESHFNRTDDRKITLNNLFDGSGVLPDNFLMTRESYIRTGAYPENHGFDTQSFETRYLGRGNNLLVCPGSIFYHRQDIGRNSYFQRVYKNGEFSKNTYLVYEDIFFLFSIENRKKIMQYDIFKNSKFGSDDLMMFVRNLYSENKENFFIKNKERYVRHDGFQLFYNDFKDSDDVGDMFACSIFLFKKKNFIASLDNIKKILGQFPESPILYYNLLRNSLSAFGNSLEEEVESKVISVARDLIPMKQKISSVPYAIISLLNKFPRFKKTIKKLLN